MFDNQKVLQAIRDVSDVFDGSELTLLERFWVCHSICTAAAGMLGMKYSELAEKMTKKSPEELVVSPSGPGGADDVADDGAGGPNEPDGDDGSEDS